MSESIGGSFQAQTKYQRGALPAGGMDPARKPEMAKTYPDAPRAALPPPQTTGGVGIWEAIRQRRSVRRYRRLAEGGSAGAGEAMGVADLSQLLWATQGLTGKAKGGLGLRTAPSAGALYPVESYVAVQTIEGIEAGLYHYAVADHALERIKAGDLRDAVARAALDQEWLYWASCVFFWTAVFDRSKWKYRERAYRYVYLDAGHIAGNLALACVALGLGSCQIAALYDNEVNAILGVDGENESVLYMSGVGRKQA